MITYHCFVREKNINHYRSKNFLPSSCLVIKIVPVGTFIDCDSNHQTLALILFINSIFLDAMASLALTELISQNSDTYSISKMLNVFSNLRPTDLSGKGALPCHTLCPYHPIQKTSDRQYITNKVVTQEFEMNEL